MKNCKKIILGCSCILFLSFSNITFASTGKVTGKTVRIREASDSSSKIVTNAYRNDEVEVISTEGDWYKVQYEGKTGYISKDYVEVKEETSSSSTTETEKTPTSNEKEPEPATPASNNETSAVEDIKIEKESNLKLLPNFSSRNLGVIQVGTNVKIEQEFNNWVEVSAGTNKGWILKRNVSGYKANVATTTTEEPVKVTIDTDTQTTETTENTTTSAPEQNTQTEAQGKKGYVNIDTARVRETAGGKIIGNIDIYDKVTILGEEGDWYKITCDDFESGYVSKDLITIGTISSRSLEEPRNIEREEIEAKIEELENQKNHIEQPKKEEVVEEPAPEPTVSNKGQEIVDYAKSFLGSRYVSGGTSPNGFDCSGFTQYVYSHFGYSLARVASGQASNGVEVSRDNLQLGDIIIFLDYGQTVIGHVGIYIGDGNFVHAANASRGVVIDNLNSNSYYNVRYVTARRII